VFRHAKVHEGMLIIRPSRNPLGSGLGVSSSPGPVQLRPGLPVREVAIPSVRVSVFRPGRRLTTFAGGWNPGSTSECPRFGSRCFVQIHGLARPPDMMSASQSPRFGSRCFASPRSYFVWRLARFHRSQSPRFGSRCFVRSGSAYNKG